MTLKRYESEIEAALFAHYTSQPDTWSVTSQLRMPGYGIADLVVETYRGEDAPMLTTIIEVKAVRAGLRVVDQVYRYADGVRDADARQGLESVIAVAICAPSFTPDLLEYEAWAEVRGELFYLVAA